MSNKKSNILTYTLKRAGPGVQLASIHKYTITKTKQNNCQVAVNFHLFNA
jgi:hypothetical protein